MSLMLRDVRDVDAVVVTSQERDLRARWYGDHPTYRFRRRMNYRTRWHVTEWLEKRRVPGLLRSVAMAGYTLIDSAVTVAGAVRIAWLLKTRRIDILHLANGFVPVDALMAGRITGVPVIVHLRSFYRGKAPSRWLKAITAAPTLVIGDSESVTQSFVDRRTHDVPSMTIHEVVDAKAFDRCNETAESIRAALNLGPDDVAVGLFGRIVPWKGQREFVLAMLSAMERNANLVAVLVGDASDGTRTYFDSIRELIRASDYSDRFRLTGYIENVEPYYAAMDIVVHASIEPEPCGMVVMEGMTAGKPVIASDEHGPREQLRPGIDGLLVPPGDTAAMSAAVLELAGDPFLRAEMGRAGYDRARELFDAPIAAARLRSVYEGILSDGRPSGSRRSGSAADVSRRKARRVSAQGVLSAV